jgi:hypothetical protein
MYPSTHWVVTAGEEPGVVGVQAFHANAGAADSPRGSGPVVVRVKGQIALTCVVLMDRGKDVGAQFGLDPVDGSGGLETPDGDALGSAHQPVASGHRRPVVEQWCIEDHDRLVVIVAYDHLEGPKRSPTEQRCHRGEVAFMVAGASRAVRVAGALRQR